jgi:hypothetical protein
MVLQSLTLQLLLLFVITMSNIYFLNNMQLYLFNTSNKTSCPVIHNYMSETFVIVIGSYAITDCNTIYKIYEINNHQFDIKLISHQTNITDIKICCGRIF